MTYPVSPSQYIVELELECTGTRFFVCFPVWVFVFKHHKLLGVPIVAQWVKNPASIHEDSGLIPGLIQ